MKHATLSVGRLAYALSAGIALVVASLDPSNTAAVGAYTLQAGIAGAVAAILPLGFDRALARHRASGSASDFPRQLIELRALEVLLVVVGSAALGWVFNAWLIALACGFFAVTRLVYADLEAFWIASGRGERTLGVIIGLNGLVTAAGIYLGAPFGGSVMVLLSALGNLLAFGALGLLGHWQVGTEPLRPIVREASGFGASAALAVAYARVDLFILAAIGLNLDAIAIYGILTRMFDALSLIRGSIAQVEMRRLAPMSPHERATESIRLGTRTALASSALSVVAVGVGYLALSLPAFSAWQPYSAAISIAAVTIPAFMSHLPTTVLILSDRRSHLLFIGSLISTSSAIVVKLILILTYGIDGAVLAIGCVELVSFLVFLLLYQSRVPARRVAPSSALPAAAVALGFWIVVSQQ